MKEGILGQFAFELMRPINLKCAADIILERGTKTCCDKRYRFQNECLEEEIGLSSGQKGMKKKGGQARIVFGKARSHSNVYVDLPTKHID